MVDQEIELPAEVDYESVASAIDEAVALAGLDVSLRDTLSTFPGSTHWHLKLGRKSGTLEVTLWPQQNRAWFSVHRNRSAAWIEPHMETVEEQIRLCLAAERLG